MKFEKRDKEVVLVCPCSECEDTYLHQEKLEEWSDDRALIRFWCENCSVKQRLEIYQHKGETFLNWYSTK
jgi:hypothetical protein